MRGPLAALLVVLAACAGAPPTDDVESDTDDTPDTDLHDTSPPEAERCVLGGPCDVLPPRASTLRCGEELRAAVAADTDLDADDDAPPWPPLLSELGCFDDLRALTPSAGVVPYTLAAPLWSDGSAKGRWFAVPPPATVTFSEDGPWGFPEGSLMLKAFGYPRVEGGPSVLVELRVMLRADDRWHFVTYRWDDALGDATRVDAGGLWETLDVIGPYGPASVLWWYPSLDGCTTCHRDLADEVLGPRTLQLRVDVHGGGQVADQAVALAAAGLLEGVPANVETLPALVSPTGNAPVPERARSWLHGQCAHCHRPGGFVSPSISVDLRYDTPLADAHLCDEPRNGTWGPRGHVVLDAGKPDVSLLVERLEVPGVQQMPPGVALQDADGVELVRAWIAGMSTCP